MKKLKHALTSALLIAPGYLCATLHYEPWVPPTNEIIINGELAYQWYHHVKFDSHAVSYHDQDVFLNLLASDSFVDRFNLEGEFGLFHSSALNNDFVSDHFALNARYQWLDTLCDDYLSLATAFSVIFPTESARKNPGEFYHTDVDMELHLSIGKQYPANTCDECVDEKGKLIPLVKNVHGMENYWADVGVGHGISGAAWLKVQAAGEKQFKDYQFVRLLADYQQGFGNQGLEEAMANGFNGYRKVSYRALDLTVRYLYEFGCNQSVSAMYAYRIYAKDCAASINQFTFNYNMAF